MLPTLLLVCLLLSIRANPLFGGEESSQGEDLATTTAPAMQADHESTESVLMTPPPVVEDTVASMETAEQDEQGSSLAETPSTTVMPEASEGQTTVQPGPLPEALPQISGPIEIRLIDENITHTHVESAIPPPPVSPIYPAEDDVTTVATQTGEQADEQTSAREGEPGKSKAVVDHHELYKKTEYVSDTVVDLEVTSTAQPTTSDDEEAQPTHETHEDPTPAAVEETTARTTDEMQPSASSLDEAALQKIQLASMLAASKRLPEGPFPDEVTDDDLPVFEGSDVGDEDDEPEPVEECLANKEELRLDIVDRMQSQAERLSKLVRKLNKQQQQYCTQHADDGSDKNVFTDQFSQCPIWREEKIVHYYKLMRITYCADYGKWPNAAKIQKTYGQYLPLFETLYAFQKQ